MPQQFALFASGERPPHPVELRQGAAHVGNVCVLAAGCLDLEPDLGQSALAFVHFGGVDDLLAEEGPDRVAEALDELVTGAQRVADEHGVTFLETDIDTDGGKMILVAGAPSTAGEDEERILRTARGIADLPTALPLRVGTSRGRVFSGEVGARFRRTYTILGKTAALAARLMGKAAPGQVLDRKSVV